MPDELRHRAKAALLGGAEPGAATGSPDASVLRAVLEVSALGRTELVSLAVVGGELKCVASDGSNDGPHVRAALAWVAGDGAAGPSRSGEASERDGAAREVSSVRVSIAAPMASPLEVREPPPPVSLGRSLDEVVTSILRTGTRGAAQSPTVDDAIARLEAALPRPVPLVVARWLGRLTAALEEQDDAQVARLLEGAIQAADAFAAEAPTPEQLHRRSVWQRAGAERGQLVMRLTERELVEIARETVRGRPQALTRRYLMCLQTGEIFVEDGPRADVPLSVGPCPRRVSVGLAELETGRAPRSVKIFQYTISHAVEMAEWSRVQRFGVNRFERLVHEYRRGLRENPSLSEPFVVVSPARFVREGVPRLVDAEGAELGLELDDVPGGARLASAPSGAASASRGAAGAPDGVTLGVLDALAAGGEVLWVAGRLVERRSRLRLVPLSLGVLDGSEIRFRRVA